MKKRPLLSVLLEIQEKLPRAHVYGDRKLSIASVIEGLRRDLPSMRDEVAEPLMSPSYWLKEDHDHLNPMIGIWHDEWIGDFPMILFEQEWRSRPGLGRRRR